ncbi:hypothetical protein FRC11_011863, partial [Ceratobasidium sp. 423]
AQSRSFETLVDEDLLPVNNLAICQACSRWRNVTLGSRTLWTHIDLYIRGEVVSLGRIFACRSGELPLSIRVIEPAKRWWNRAADYHIELSNFLSDFGSRVRSFEVTSQIPPLCFRPKAWHGILEVVFNHASSEFTQLVLSNRPSTDKDIFNVPDYTSYYGLLFPQDSTLSHDILSADGVGVELFNVPQERLENVLSNIQILELDLIYPLYESKAYHGLTELRLTGPRKPVAIWTTQQLASILAASPRLRTLQFGFEVLSVGVMPKPIRLEDLEVFSLQSLSFNTQQAILQLISPGVKQLHMSTT